MFIPGLHGDSILEGETSVQRIKMNDHTITREYAKGLEGNIGVWESLALFLGSGDKA